MLPRYWRRILVLAMLLSLGAGAAAAADAPQISPAPTGGKAIAPSAPALLVSEMRVEQALQNILSLQRPHQDGYATIWDGNKYIQCGLARGGGLRCEAAGSLMQPTLARLLTADRTELLAQLGWALDPRFGNYVHVFSATAEPKQVAIHLLLVLNLIYDADVANLEVHTDWIAREPCPPRNGPGQNLAGMISDAPSMASAAVHACRFVDDSPVSVTPESTAGLIFRYGPRVTGEIQRLRVNLDRQVHVIFDTGIGYIQCETQTKPDAIYCEAQSADTWAALGAVLTPDRIARLHAAGYADPGRAPNYWKAYPIDTTKDADIAAEVLTQLHDAYGYAGAAPLEIVTEKGEEP